MSVRETVLVDIHEEQGGGQALIVLDHITHVSVKGAWWTVHVRDGGFRVTRESLDRVLRGLKWPWTLLINGDEAKLCP